MAYEKRVCVMKQVKKGFSADGGALSGAVYCERMGERVKVTPRLLGLAPVREGRYFFALKIGGRAFHLEFSGGQIAEFEAPSLEGGFCALLCFIKGDTAEAVAYGACGRERSSPEELLEGFVRAGGEKRKRRPPNPLPPTELPSPAPNVPTAPVPVLPEPVPEDEEPFRDRLAAVYDDEAIAAVDYYNRHEDENVAGAHQKEGGANAGGSDSVKDEAVPPRPVARTLAYYNTVRERLNEAFKKYPRDDRYLIVFPASEWVEANGALLGVVYEEGSPKYLCIAQKERFPEEACGGGIFVPFSPLNENEGMFVVFQDADSGDYVKVYDA